MTTKTLTIREEAYKRLKEFKKKGESFSDVILDLTGAKSNFRSGFGEWKGSTEKLEETIQEGRKKLDKAFRERQ